MKTVINNIHNTFPVSLHNNRQAVFITQPETAGTLLEFITEAELTGVAVDVRLNCNIDFYRF